MENKLLSLLSPAYGVDDDGEEEEEDRTSKKEGASNATLTAIRLASRRTDGRVSNSLRSTAVTSAAAAAAACARRSTVAR